MYKDGVARREAAETAKNKIKHASRNEQMIGVKAKVSMTGKIPKQSAVTSQKLKGDVGLTSGA